MFDVLFHNALVVRPAPDTREAGIIEDGIVGVRGGRIAELGPKDPAARLPSAAETVDAKGKILIPGLVNTHTHLPMALFRGLADDLPLETWLNEHIFPAEARHVNPESVRLGAMLACAELLLSGTTTCCDGYFLESYVAEAVADAGLRAVLGQGVIDFPAPGVPDPARNVSVAEDFVGKWGGAHPRIHPSVFCHAPYTCSERTLTSAKEAARRHGVLFQIHVAETRSEVEQMHADHGLSPVAYLDRLGILDEDTLVVHGVWVDEEDIRILAETGCPVSHNPQSNMKLASGIAPVPKMLDAGICVGLGTDGCASNNDLDLFSEMDTAAKLHKVSTLDPTVLSADQVLKMATIDGAKALGLGEEIGSLEIGKRADLVIVDTDAPHMIPLYRAVSHLVYAARGADVKDVMIDGRFVVRDRRLLTVDLKDLLDRVSARCRRIGGVKKR